MKRYMKAAPALAAALAAIHGPAAIQAESGAYIDEIVVTAGGFEQRRILAPGSVTVVTRAELEALPVANLADLLRGLAGIDLDGLDARSNKTGNRTISLRGLPSEYTLVLIDGKRQNVPGTVAPNAFVDSASMFFPPLAAIERIEIVRSPMSTLYGADALAGVVNVITRRPGTEWAGSVNASGLFQNDSDFGGEHALEAHAAGPLGPQSLGLGLQLHARAWERAASRNTFPGQDLSLDRRRSMGQVPVAADVQTVGAKLLWAPTGAHELFAGVDLTRQTYDNSLGQLGQINAAAAPGSAGFPDRRSGYAPELGFNRDQYFVGHDSALGIGDWSSTLTRNTVETTGRTIPNAAASEASGRRGTARRLETETTVLDTKLVMDAGAHRVSVGGQFIDAQMFDGIPDRRFETRQWGVFAEDQWSFAPRWTLTGGLRYDKNDAFGGQVTPRAYLVYSVSRQWTFKGGVGQGYRAPFLEQLEAGIIGYGEGGTVPLFGNPDLKPEESTNYEFSGIYQGEGFFAEVTLFHTDLKNRVERPVGATGGTTDNVGEARIQGAELTADWRLSEAWSVDANYTLVDSEITSDAAASLVKGDPLFGVPRHSLNSRLNWLATERVSAFVGAQYRSKRFRPDNFHEPHLGGNAQGATEVLGDFRAFTTFNLGTRFLLSERVTLQANIENLLDKDFSDYRPYPLRNNPDVTAYSNVYNNIYPPRRLWLSMTASF